jgi:nucleoid-associated protein YgaU
MAGKDDIKKGTPLKPGGIASKKAAVPPKPSAKNPVVPPKAGVKPPMPPKAGVKPPVGTPLKAGIKPPMPPKDKAPAPDVFDRSASSVMPKAPVYIAEHKVVEGDTLSGIALKYYGSAVKAKWQVIELANKALLDQHKGVLLPGMVLKIPELPK